MKKVFYAILSVLSFQPVFAEVFTVSNAAVSPGQYASIGAAIAAASTGDTILIQGTGINYGNFTVNKKLVFIGPGHNPTDKQNVSPAMVDNILLTTGGSSSAFYGLSISYIYISTANDITGIVVSNCMIRSRIEMGKTNCNNWTLDGTIFTSSDINISGYSNTYGHGTTTNLRVRNCVFNGRITDFNTNSGYNYITNSIFLQNSTSGTFGGINYFYVTNSIFYRAIPRLTNATYTSGGWINFNNCISFSTNGGNNAFTPNSDGTTRTVWEGVDPQFEDFPLAGSFFDYAHNYRLKATSPVKNSGNDATDLGVYGGTQFSNILLGYNQNGIPINPYIKSFNITGSNSVNAGDNLQISVEAKVRN
jgi:hypothetical protein